jgi:hypothetical protein
MRNSFAIEIEGVANLVEMEHPFRLRSEFWLRYGNFWWHRTISFREFGRCTFVAFRERLTIAAFDRAFGSWTGKRTGRWPDIPEPKIQLVSQCAEDENAQVSSCLLEIRKLRAISWELPTKASR